ncbi:MAG: LLM class flavin-dependent oxidoreductase [Rhodospirillaceae bacterium]|nr:MAG: LLM class flavin-dependent oxidoreductase [Rhodospirillaceae bacterium]
MKVQLGAFLRTTLPLDLSVLKGLDDGRYHSVWLPDHMVSFWPDSIWTPEFTDLAIDSPSPHRHLDALAVAGAAAVLTKNVPIATKVVDTVRRHPSLLAQTALTIDHLSRGRFILGLGSGELENTVPYGFDFSKPVSRFEESLKVIRLLWETNGPVDFEGQFYKLHHARLDTEPFEGRFPKIYVGSVGPRMLEITGRYADGWYPAGVHSPEDYAAKLKIIQESAERAGRDPLAIVPTFMAPSLIGDDAEVAEMLQAPLIKAYVLQIPAALMRQHGFAHPMGENWRGIHDINPGLLTRDIIVDLLKRVNVDAIRAIVPNGSPQKIARYYKTFVDAGARVPKILDYGGQAGSKFRAVSGRKVREAEDELMRLVGEN